ncbi:MAG: pyruvate, phosphate dikinase [Planctomycetes bacterium]|nr:pyruvate, phosphate dikinase [Planctomycetota bacterium]
MPKYIYFFGGGKADGDASMKDLLGGKGAGVAEMTRAGIPVPPGFTLTTQLCRLWYADRKSFPKDLDAQMLQNLARVEALTGMKFGDATNPLLVSVRSGAKVSMPGMMDTILNLGLNDKTVLGLAGRTGNERFAWDCYRRLIQMFGNVVLDIDKENFERSLKARKAARGIVKDTDLTAEDLRALVEEFKATVQAHAGKPFPQDPARQLMMARDAVFRSWNNQRAIDYRNIYKIPHDLGTAVTVQSMVFGNTGDKSGTGVGFTRDPGSGDKVFFGEYLTNAQGEDVVAGIRTPLPIAQLDKEMPEVFAQLREITGRLERHYRDVQDFEFTVQEGRLYMLQTRSAKRTGFAAVRFAVDMMKEGVLTPEEAVLRVEPDHLQQLLFPVFDREKRKAFAPVAKGLNASPGAASGAAVFSAEESVRRAGRGERVVLVRAETCPDDVKGMKASQGVLTATGGRTSHAAVVGRQMGKPCVVGCGMLAVDEHARQFTVGEHVVREGDALSIDGTTGEVMIGEIPTRESDIIRVLRGELPAAESELFAYYSDFMACVTKVGGVKVRANADVPADAEAARHFGAQGIGLCRTEHMFFAAERLPIVQQMILFAEEAKRAMTEIAALEAKAKKATGPEKAEEEAKLAKARAAGSEPIAKYRGALDQLLPLQRGDFLGLFRTMKGFPVTIRTIDPPLHEFLPKREELMVEIAVAKAKGETGEALAAKERLLERVESLHEFNPMLGHRGCRLGITFPEITEMQVRAIFEAACEVAGEGQTVVPEVMIPLVGHVNELKDQKAIAVRIAEETMKRTGRKLAYLVGTMIEVPRAALVAEEIATEAQFFSFGTNDLTQMTFGYSRDDAGKFLKEYVQDSRVLPTDPFVSIDRSGVGQLMRLSVEKGRAARPGIKLGICGEHGGDPDSIEFCAMLGLDYVSCSPYRVAVARLAAAQSLLRSRATAAKAKPERATKRDAAAPARKPRRAARVAAKASSKVVAERAIVRPTKPAARPAMASARPGHPATRIIRIAQAGGKARRK